MTLLFGEHRLGWDNAWVTTIPDTSAVTPRHQPPEDLSRFAWLSIAAATATILLKALAWWITGSVGLLSDAAESLVNLVAAVIALVALKVSIRPPDKNHQFGHSKAEYFSAGAEGMMIFIAAAVIIYTAIQRFFHPQSIEDVGCLLYTSDAADE